MQECGDAGGGDFGPRGLGVSASDDAVLGRKFGDKLTQIQARCLGRGASVGAAQAEAADVAAAVEHNGHFGPQFSCHFTQGP